MAINDIINQGWHGHTMQEVREALQEILSTLMNSENNAVEIVDDLLQGGSDKALSAEMGKLLKSLLDGKVPMNGTGRVDYSKLPSMVLSSMGEQYDEGGSYSPKPGDIFYSNGSITQIKPDGSGVDIFMPSADLIYWNAMTKKPYRWSNGRMEQYNPVDVSGKADLLMGMLSPKQWPQVVIRNVSGDYNDFEEVGQGDIFFDQSDNQLKRLRIDEDANLVYDPIGKPNEGTLYCVKDSGELYRWDNSGTGWVKVGGSYDDVPVNNIINVKDNKNYRVWVGTAEEFAALGGDLEDDVVYLVGVAAGGSQPNEIPITGITVAVTRSGNNIYLQAALEPADTTQRGVTWDLRPVDRTYASLIPEGLKATLYPRGGDSDGVNVLVTCRSTKYDTNGVEAEVPLTLTYETPEPVTPGVTIASISYTEAGANQLQFAASFNPETETDTVTWSVDNTALAEINASTGLLTIKASGTVTVTATGTNNSKSLPVQLTYTQQPVTGNITDIGDINLTRVSGMPNTYILSADADGDTPSITFELIEITVPYVKRLVRTESEVGGETVVTSALTDVANVVIDGNLLTFKEDCEIRLRARAGNVVSNQPSLTQLTHTDDDAIWFEDELMLAYLRTLNIGSGTGAAAKVTYRQAAAVTQLTVDSDEIERFKEFKWFTGINRLGYRGGNYPSSRFSGCAKLKCIGLPTSITEAYATTNNPFSGCSLSEVHVNSVENYLNIFFTGATAGKPNALPCFYNAGLDAEGLGLYVDGEEITELEIPSTVATLHQFALSGFTHITKVTIHAQAIEGNPFVPTTVISGKDYTAVEEIVVGNEVSSLPISVFEKLMELTSVDLGAGISSIPAACFRASVNLVDLTLRHNAGVVSLASASAFATAANSTTYFKGNIKLHVPLSLVGAYQSSSDWNDVDSVDAVFDENSSPGTE